MSASPAPAGNGGVGVAQFFDRVLSALEGSVRTLTRLVMYSKANGRKLDRLADAMTAQADAVVAGREQAVDEVKTHIANVVKMELAASTRWERRFLIVVGVLIVLSNLIGQPVGAFLERVFRIAR